MVNKCRCCNKIITDKNKAGYPRLFCDKRCSAIYQFQNPKQKEIRSLKMKGNTYGKANKGRKFSEEHKNNLSKVRKGKCSSKKLQHLQRLGKIQMGKNNPFYGKHHTEESKKKISKSQLGKKELPESIEKRIKTTIERGSLRGSKNGMYGRTQELNPFYGKHHTKETIERTLPKILKRLKERPTSLEKRFIEFNKKYKLSFIYCGDGSFIIAGKNPDFIINNKNICIEVANRFHHKGNYEVERIKYFKDYGYNCLVIWEEELKLNNENNLLQKIKNFKDNL